jgi:hypothetical protein
MKELYSNLWGSLSGFVQTWLLPSAIACGFFTLVLLPALDGVSPWSQIKDLQGAERGLLFVFASLVVSFLLAATARPLTRVLEGYALWPPALKVRMTARQIEKRKALRKQIGEATEADAVRLRQRLNRYPRKSALVLPTRLGNALRAGETYGYVQYGLSTVGLWTRLTAVADENTNNQLNQAKAIFNFFVAMIWLSMALSLVTAAVAVVTDETTPVWWVPFLLALLPLWYGRALESVTWYAQGMHALVDLNRGKLADALGLRLPGTLEEERELWEAVSEYAAWGPGWEGSAAWVKVLDEATVPRGAKPQSSGGTED